tara:strand:- start:274 stop:1014 length:741 start_codon:yes stop_codon:yes gene_type:complete
VKAAASILHKQVQAKPDSVLGLATGGTMLHLYEDFITLCRQKSTTLSKITTFNLDEYVGLASAHPHSYHSYMQEHLFSKTDIDTDTTYLPRGDAPDPHQEATSYETMIKSVGGIDLQLLGIGKNGHIGFNEPSSSLASRTRVKTLSVGTIEANRQYFQGDGQFPKMAITMGVETIMSSRECIVVATGADKSEAIAKMVEGPVSASCPASVLQFHQNVTVLIDEQAAGALQMRAYYQQVHPRGYNND